MIFLVLFVLDKLLKIVLINSDISLIVNEGVFLGIMVDPLVIFLISALVFCLIIFLYRKGLLIEISLKIIFLGAMMNITDRIFWGGVIDFLKIPGVFIINLADVIMCIGIINLIYSKYISEQKHLFKSK